MIKRLCYMGLIIISAYSNIEITDKSSMTYHNAHSSKGQYCTKQIWEDVELNHIKFFDINEIGTLSDIDDFYKDGIPGDIKGDSKIVAYEWFAGFYNDDYNKEEKFYRWVMKSGKDMLLNYSSDIHPMGNDYYFDMCNRKLVNKRVKYLTQKAKKYNIDGYFFDWANSRYLYDDSRFSDMRDIIKRRYPNKDYKDCIKTFFKKLKKNNILIISNQAYRDEDILEYVDYDMVESYLTNIESKREMVVNDRLVNIGITSYDSFDDILYYFNLLNGYKDRYREKGFKNFIYVNYITPLLEESEDGYITKKPIDDLFYTYGMILMNEFIPYTEVPFNRNFETTELYSIKLGKPQGEIKRNNGFIYRYFDNGIILSSHLTKPLDIVIDKLEEGRYIYDIKNDNNYLVKDGKIYMTIYPSFDKVSGGYKPISLILVYK